MNQKFNPPTFNEAIELAKQSPNHTIKIVLPAWHVTVRVDEISEKAEVENYRRQMKDALVLAKKNAKLIKKMSQSTMDSVKDLRANREERGKEIGA